MWLLPVAQRGTRYPGGTVSCPPPAEQQRGAVQGCVVPVLLGGGAALPVGSGHPQPGPAQLLGAVGERDPWGRVGAVAIAALPAPSLHPAGASRPRAAAWLREGLGWEGAPVQDGSCEVGSSSWGHSGRAVALHRGTGAGVSFPAPPGSGLRAGLPLACPACRQPWPHAGCCTGPGRAEVSAVIVFSVARDE